MIKAYLFNPWIVCATLVAGGLVLLVIDDTDHVQSIAALMVRLLADWCQIDGVDDRIGQHGAVGLDAHRLLLTGGCGVGLMPGGEARRGLLDGEAAEAGDVARLGAGPRRRPDVGAPGAIRRGGEPR